MLLDILRTDLSNYNIYNYYVLSIMGIAFEIIGGLFLSMEAIGLNRFTKAYNIIYVISNWSKKNMLRVFLVTSRLFILLTVAIFSSFKVISGLIVPIMFLIILTTLLFDHPDWYENWIIFKTKKGQISAIGFLIIVFGNILQFVSLIWQMSINN